MGFAAITPAMWLGLRRPDFSGDGADSPWRVIWDTITSTYILLGVGILVAAAIAGVAALVLGIPSAPSNISNSATIIFAGLFIGIVVSIIRNVTNYYQAKSQADAWQSHLDEVVRELKSLLKTHDDPDVETEVEATARSLYARRGELQKLIESAPGTIEEESMKILKLTQARLGIISRNASELKGVKEDLEDKKDEIEYLEEKRRMVRTGAVNNEKPKQQLEEDILDEIENVRVRRDNLERDREDIQNKIESEFEKLSSHLDSIESDMGN